MSVLLRDNFGYLHLLTRCPEPQRQVLLATATPEQVHVMCEVCHNLLKGHISISQGQKERLEPYKDDIRVLAHASVPFKTKKKLLVQKGGGLVEEVLPPLMSALSLFLL